MQNPANQRDGRMHFSTLAEISANIRGCNPRCIPRSGMCHRKVAEHSPKIQISPKVPDTSGETSPMLRGFLGGKTYFAEAPVKHPRTFHEALGWLRGCLPGLFPDITSGAHREKFQCKHFAVLPMPPDVTKCLTTPPKLPRDIGEHVPDASRGSSIFTGSTIPEAKNAQWDRAITFSSCCLTDEK